MSNVGNWVGEICTTIGTGDLELGGNINSSFVKFSDAFTDSDLVYYAIVDVNNRECGVGTYSSNTIVRTTVEATLTLGVFADNSPAPLSLSGSAQVFCTFNKVAFDVFKAAITSQSSDISALEADVASLFAAVSGKESSLGNPASDGYVLSSTAAGVRSWVPQTPVMDPGMDPLTYDPQGITADAFARANHTGTQASSTISDFTSAASAAAPVQSVAGKAGVVTLDKTDVGLPNVVNLDTSNPTNITQSASYRFVTDTEKSTWNAKIDRSKTVASLSSSSGVITIDCSSTTDLYQVALTEDVSSWSFTNLPPSGKCVEMEVQITQHASSAKTVVSPATSGKTAGGAWTQSTALSAVEVLGIRVFSDGTKHVFPSGVFS